MKVAELGTGPRARRGLVLRKDTRSLRRLRQIAKRKSQIKSCTAPTTIADAVANKAIVRPSELAGRCSVVKALGSQAKARAAEFAGLSVGSEAKRSPPASLRARESRCCSATSPRSIRRRAAAAARAGARRSARRPVRFPGEAATASGATSPAAFRRARLEREDMLERPRKAYLSQRGADFDCHSARR